MTTDPRPFLRDLLAARPCSFLADKNLWDRAEELLRSLPEDGGGGGGGSSEPLDDLRPTNDGEFEI